MINKDDIKLKSYEVIDKNSIKLIELAKTISRNAETGFREFNTSELVKKWFDELNIKHQDNIAITGVNGIVNSMKDGPTISVIGELDSNIVPGHPEGNPETGAGHACGHQIQIANMIAVAVAVTKANILDNISGSINFMAIPAEEYIELEFRKTLKDNGQIKYLTGKGEFIRLGLFDNVDIAFMTHATSDNNYGKLLIPSGNNGLIAKKIEFIGISSHAGTDPHNGINALNAANLSLQAIHMLRETFKDNDTIRVHPIITKGGASVNQVPDSVHVETYIRAKTLDAVLQTNNKIDKAIKHCALALGAKVKISNLGGMLPMINDSNLSNIYKENSEVIVGKENVKNKEHSGGSTDMGDVSHLIPSIHPYVTGASGSHHTHNFKIEDYDLTVITAAKAMLGTLIDILYDDAKLGNKIISEHKPKLTKNEYLDIMDNLYSENLYQ